MRFPAVSGSSTSTVTAPAGQIDYVAANEYLNAYAQSRAGGETRVVALNWGIWNEVGMAAEAVAERTGDVPEIPVTDVTAPLLLERMKKRIVYKQPPNSTALRDAMKNAHGHLDYMDWLIDNRPWLAGSTMSLADLAAAAQISVADYLGGIDWKGHDQTRGWYSVFKSRPSFRPLLSERMDVIKPPAHYALVDG